MLSLGFDRYQRFRAAAQLLEQIAAGQALNILEVGAFDNAFQPFVAGHQHQCWQQLVRPGSPLPFTENEFEVSLALDVLEHVPLAERAFFIKELVRIAGRATILGFPTQIAEAAEKFVLRLTGSAWLAQHQELGLPDKLETEQLFKHLGLSFSCHPNGALPSWTAMMLLMHGVQGDLRDEISAFFNKHYYELENREPAYRYIYILTK